MCTSTYWKKNTHPVKVFTHPGPGGPSCTSLKTPRTSPSLHPWAIDWVLPELTKPGPLLTHTALSPRSLSQNSWMQTRHMRPLSGLCAVREGALLPGFWHSLRLWLFLHALCVTPTFSPLPLLYHIYGPGVSMSVKGFSAAPITPRRNTWYLGNKEFWDWQNIPVDSRVTSMFGNKDYSSFLFACLGSSSLSLAS